MASDDKLLETVFLRATDPAGDKVDEFAVRMFCIIVSKDEDLIMKATDLIVSKVKSTNVTQSIKALSLLDECMSKGGPQFRKEVSKFRFLNELIRLVSKKYLASETNPEIRDKIMDSLLIWTLQYPDKIKIKEAYDMLIKEGVEHAPAFANIRNPTTSTKRASFLDEENDRKLKKLVQSKNPEDRQKANLLIQYLVNQDAKKTELKIRQKSELKQIQETVNLLSEILDTWIEDPNSKDSGESTLMKELYENCEKYRPILLQMPETLEGNDEDLIADTIETNDLLLAVMGRYQELILSNAKPCDDANPLASVGVSRGGRDLLGDLLVNKNLTQSKSVGFSNLSQNLEELSEIFSKSDLIASSIPVKNNASEIFKNIDLLQPIPAQTPLTSSKPVAEAPTAESSKSALSYIDQLSEDLLMQSKERVDHNKKLLANMTLNDMIKEKSSIKVEMPESLIACEIEKKNFELSKQLLVVDEPIKIPETPIQETIDPIQSNVENIKETEPQASGASSNLESIIKHLADINIELDDVTPSSELPRTLLDDSDGLKVTLNFTSNRPSKNISAVVITTVNQGKIPIENVHFDASVPKPCKLRLLSPTGTYLPGVKPFRPPTESIHQIMLILNTTNANIDVTCIVGYKTTDDPDPIKESIIAKNIPF